jgi:tetratricopeptide (TPR) repeat protein
LEGVGSLVDKSLLRQEVQRDGELRFYMLETVREYGLEQLAAAGEVEALHDRQVDFFTGLAEEQLEAGASPVASWLDRMEQDRANLRSAMDWLIESGDAVAALRLARGARHFWRLHSHTTEGRRLLERALALPTVPEAPLRHQAAVLMMLGEFAMHQGDLPEARAAWEKALLAHQGAGANMGVAVALKHLAVVEIAAGQPAAARPLLERSRLAHRAAGQEHEDPMWCSLAGRAELLEGNVVAARAHYEEGLAVARAIGERNDLVGLTMGLGDIALRDGSLVEARSHYAESLRVAAEFGNRRAIAEGFEQVAGVAVAEGQSRVAVVLGAAAHRLREESGAPRMASGEARLQEVMEHLPDEAERVAAWAEGRALTLEQAISLALGSAPS